MKFRPQIQLRFRDAWDYERVKGLAAVSGLSMNEWILRKIENGALTELNSRDAGKAEKRVSSRPKSTGIEGDGRSLAGNQSGQRTGHDPKTCRVYGCGMCKAAKEKS